VARNSPLARALLRVRGSHSADDRDVARALRRALKRVARREGEPQAVQVAGEALEPDDYARWRERKLRRGALTWAPELGPGHYALVLYAIEPSTTEQFIRHGAGRHLTPPTVGDFKAAIEPAVALAGTLASWLETFEWPVVLAPPLLYTAGRWRVADLGLDWPLAPYWRERR
jgi:hypothetical protein